MSSTSSPSLRLDVRARRSERHLVVGMVVLAALAPWFFPLSFPFQCLASVGLTALVGRSVAREGWLEQPHRMVELVWSEAGQWFISLRSGQQLECDLHRSSRVSSQVIWLRFIDCDSGHLRHLLLSRWDLEHADFRRLGVRLRLDGARSLRTAGARLEQRA